MWFDQLWSLYILPIFDDIIRPPIRKNKISNIFPIESNLLKTMDHLSPSDLINFRFFLGNTKDDPQYSSRCTAFVAGSVPPHHTQRQSMSTSSSRLASHLWLRFPFFPSDAKPKNCIVSIYWVSRKEEGEDHPIWNCNSSTSWNTPRWPLSYSRSMASCYCKYKLLIVDKDYKRLIIIKRDSRYPQAAI